MLLLACNPAAPLSNEAFVWQRVWTSEVRAAVVGAQSQQQGLVVLAGEVDFLEGEARLLLAEPDYMLLKTLSIPVGIAIRVGVFPGQDFPKEAEEASARIERSLQYVFDTGFMPSELHIDHDCPTSKLSLCMGWLESLPTHGLPLSITALPTWLDSPAFPELLKLTEDYVLQVHMLEKTDTGYQIYNPEQADRWIEQAAALKKPFRLALPTYNYPLGSQRIEADPEVLAQQVAGWKKRHPIEMKGILWFRLPVLRDTGTWALPTLLAVQEGRVPEARLEVELNEEELGLYMIEVVNTGERRGTGRFYFCGSIESGAGLQDWHWNLGGWLEGGQVEPGQRVVAGWIRGKVQRCRV
jgi:hypothetical protein